MAWWRKVSPPVQTEQEQVATAEVDRELDEAHAEADRALKKVRELKREKLRVGQVIGRIRMENHFADLWKNDGVGA